MKPITISLNPTYLCNFRCDFCYLTEEQLSDKNKLSVSKLETMLEEISFFGYTVDHVDLYGGEVGLLPEIYLKDLDNLLYHNGNPSINVITNLSKVNPYFLEDHVDLSVSYDFEARINHTEVFHNIAKLGKEVSILMLASPKLMKLNVEDMIIALNSLQNIKSVEIKPYSTNQANKLDITDQDYEEFIKQWFNAYTKFNFKFINAQRIKDSLDGTYSAFSDTHVYITPAGKFAVLEFDENDNEYFLEFDNFAGYVEWAESEKKRVNNNKICGECPYLGNCLTEHYRDVKSLEYSCNGFRHLLDWSKERRSLVDWMAQ